MAEIVKARDTSVPDGPVVAVKRILPHLVDDEQFVTMFLDESRVLSGLEHEHIIRTLDVGVAEGTPYLALEFVDGKDARMLFMRMRKNGYPLPLPVACYIMARVCDGLHHAHEHVGPDGQPLRLVHRDVSLQNLLLSFSGDVKVTDFGIALSVENLAHTQTGIVKGKFGYMSPEQIRGKSVDRRTDIFSAGICLYELLTAERLFTGETEYDALVRVRNVDIVPAREVNAAIPEDLDRILTTALAKEPQDRFQTAAEMASALQEFMVQNDCEVLAEELGACMRDAFSDRWNQEIAADSKTKRAEKATSALSLPSDLVPLTDLKPHAGTGAISAANSGPSLSSPHPLASPTGAFRGHSGAFSHSQLQSQPTSPSIPSANDAAPAPEGWGPRFPAPPLRRPTEGNGHAPDVDDDVTRQHHMLFGAQAVSREDVGAPNAPLALQRFDQTGWGAIDYDAHLRAPSARDRLHVLAFRSSLLRVGVPVLLLVTLLFFGLYVYTQSRRAAIHLVTEPVNVDVQVNGEPVAGSGSPFLLRDLEPDVNYRIDVKKDGYEPWFAILRVAPGETLVIPVVRLASIEKEAAVPAGIDPALEPSSIPAPKPAAAAAAVSSAPPAPSGTASPGLRPTAAPPLAEPKKAANAAVSPTASPTPSPATGDATEFESADGELHLLSIEPGEVYVDGELVGNTPNLKVPLSPGRHRIRWEAEDGSGRRVFGVRAVAGRKLIRNLTPTRPPDDLEVEDVVEP